MNTLGNKHLTQILNRYDDAFMKEDYKKAFKIIKEIEKFNNSECYWRLAETYEFGYGVSKNLHTSSDYYSKAIDLGDLRWLTDLGNIYRKLGDYSKAIGFFKKGINSDQMLSYFYLARMHEFGYGVKRNKSRAIIYYKKGASLGHKYSKAKMANFTRRGQFGKFKVPCGYIMGIIIFIETLILTFIDIGDERLSGFE